MPVEKLISEEFQSIRCMKNGERRSIEMNDVLMMVGGEKTDHKFPKDKSLSISKNIEDIVKELSEELYLSRREFLKAVGVASVAMGAVGTTGCLEPVENYFKQREREKRRIKPEELEKLNRVDVLYFDGSEKEL